MARIVLLVLAIGVLVVLATLAFLPVLPAFQPTMPAPTPTSEPQPEPNRPPQPTEHLPVNTPVLATVATEALHVRECASIDCRVIGWLRQGDTIHITGPCAGNWAQVQDGWINAVYTEPNPCLKE